MEKKNHEKSASIESLQGLSEDDIKSLKAEFYSEKDILEVEQNFNKVHFSVSVFNNAAPEKKSAESVTIEDAKSMLSRKDFISAIAAAVLENGHYSISRINIPNGMTYLTMFL